MGGGDKVPGFLWALRLCGVDDDDDDDDIMMMLTVLWDYTIYI